MAIPPSSSESIIEVSGGIFSQDYPAQRNIGYLNSIKLQLIVVKPIPSIGL
jgi:hypothetical protein